MTMSMEPNYWGPDGRKEPDSDGGDVRNELIEKLEAISEDIRADIQIARAYERRSYLRGELYGVQQAIDLARGFRAVD